MHLFSQLLGSSLKPNKTKTEKETNKEQIKSRLLPYRALEQEDFEELSAGLDSLLDKREGKYQLLKYFAHATSRADFLRFFIPAEQEGQTGLRSLCLRIRERASEYQALQNSVAQYCQKYIAPFLKHFGKEKKLPILVEHVSLLAMSTCPKALSTEAKALHAKLTAWMYISDDSLGQMRTKVYANKRLAQLCPPQAWFSAYIRQVNIYCLSCLDAALAKKELPPPPHFKQLLEGHELSRSRYLLLKYIDRLKGRNFTMMAELGKMLYACAQELHSFAVESQEQENAESMQLFRDEILRYLKGLIEETKAAPAEPEAYLERHAATGAVLPCFELNILLMYWQEGKQVRDIEKTLGKELRAKALQFANYSVLCGNETCFLKDIGDEEESLAAVLCAQMSPQLQGKDMSSQKAHAQVLLQDIQSVEGFRAVERIFIYLEKQLYGLVELAEQFEQEQALHSFFGILLKWAFGYQHLNPLSARYGMSYPLQQAVLEGDYPLYKSIVEQKQGLHKPKA